MLLTSETVTVTVLQPQEPASKLAAMKLGIELSTMRPRTLESFKEGPTDNADSLSLKYVVELLV